VRARAMGVSLPDGSYVFGRSPGAIEPCVPNDVTKDFIQLRKQVGLEGVRLHDLRHFAATRMLVAGVPVRTVSGRLGHANAATTLGVCAHFVDASDRDAAAILGGFVGAPAAAADAGVSSEGTDRPSASGGVASQS
jgi:integrase